MRIAILGTRGIPNEYGGFEQLAEYLSVALVKRGHEVTVYQSSLHSYKENSYQGVTLVRCYDPENKFGTAGQFIYDFNAIMHSRSQKFDAILQLGYTSSSIWSFLLPGGSRVITNMDGLEWKRSKYSKPVQQFLKFAEGLAVRSSDTLIADSNAIQSYLTKKYSRESVFIPYGATVFNNPDAALLNRYDLHPYHYYMAMARPEPENNAETIIRGFIESGADKPLVMIGSVDNAFGQYLTKTYGGKNIRFMGKLYDMEALNNLRYFSQLYFHGHSVGGTNPSLLEAMASQALVCAHGNEFNRAVLGDDAIYFENASDVAKHLAGIPGDENRRTFIANNLHKITTQYTWPLVIDAYEKVIATEHEK